MTKLNESILKIVRESNGHLTAEEVFLLAKAKNVKVSVASTYRILNKLAQDNYIKRISNMGDKDIYDKFVNDHEHLVCSVCGCISDINIKDFKKRLEKELGVKIDSYDLSIKYVCEECGKKEKK